MADRMCYSIFRVILFVLATAGREQQKQRHCNSTQYLEFGKTGTVECSFGEGMFAVYWYDSEDVTKTPTFFYQESKKSGYGYTTGEFDVEPNGSLVIRNVTFKHDHVFTVACLADKDTQTVSVSVTVVVYVKPNQTHPFVSECYGTNSCFRTFTETPSLSCFVKESRPAVILHWFKRTGQVDQRIHSKESVQSLNNSLFTSYANLTNFTEVEPYSVVVCKSLNALPMLKMDESIVLLEGTLNISLLKPEQIFVEKSAKMALKCPISRAHVVVWKKHEKDELRTLIGLVSGKSVLNSSEYHVNAENSLIIEKTAIRHEGVYECVHGDGRTAKSILYNVTVFVHPVPRDPIVDGCSLHRPCVITNGTQGELTCKLTGVRPLLQLKWKVVHNSESEKIILINEKTEVFRKDETYDVVATTQYRLIDMTLPQAMLECLSFGVFADIVNVSKEVKLMFGSSKSEENVAVFLPLMTWLMVLLTLLPTFLSTLFCVLILKGKVQTTFRWNARQHTSTVYHVVSQDNTEETSISTFDNSNENIANFSEEAFAKVRHYVGVDKLGDSDLIDEKDILNIPVHKHDSKSAGFGFLQSVLSNDNGAVTVFLQQIMLEGKHINLKRNEELFSYVHQKSDQNILQQKEYNVSYRDAIFTIYHSCKSSLRQHVVSRMSTWGFAVPLLLPRPVNRDEVVFLLSDLQHVSKDWLENGTSKRLPVTAHSFPTIAALRIGETGVSKSNILNLIIGRLQQGVDSFPFITSNEDNNSSVWAYGTVEAVWLPPSTVAVPLHGYTLSTATCFLNLRGKMDTGFTKLQESFLCTFSSCVIIFIKKSSYNEHYDSLVHELSKNTHVIVVVVTDKYVEGQSSPRIIKQGNCLTVIIFERCSELKIAIELCKQISLVLKNSETTKTLDKEGQQLCEDLNVKVE